MVECVQQAGYQLASTCLYGSAGKKWNQTEGSGTTSNPKLERKKEKEKMCFRPGLNWRPSAALRCYVRRT